MADIFGDRTLSRFIMELLAGTLSQGQFARRKAKTGLSFKNERAVYAILSPVPCQVKIS